ncbi:LysR family transcriptional regulator [Mycoavidus sp. SF9855]|uniref:LysR family transcriptional regulator n=1 Tax=Mycoavidus sp. SF9855 TaxID=2968475 RepID=UPI00211BE926|nr:LysR substrate-binding domain-containing protein [Mycoavidus sp. SF9855]UUM22054.1 LysR substrate-binding domain-containing protein [Mycoavidus sp. SF9855]
MIINQQRLCYFNAVFTHREICKAAESMSTNASVITNQIKILEREIGYKLFEYRPSEVAPTYVAELLLEYYRQSRDARMDFEVGLQELGDIREGNIHLAIPAIFVHVFMDIFDNFRLRYPGVHLQIEEIFETTKIIDQILSDTADIGIADVFQESPDIQHYAHVPFPLYLLVGKNHPLAGKRKVTFSEAVSYPVSLPASGILRQKIQAVAQSERVQLCFSSFVSNSTTARKIFASTGPGAVFMSAFSAREEIEAGTLIALEVDHLAFQASKMALLTKRGNPIFPATDHLLRLLKERLSVFTFSPEVDNNSSIPLGASNAE